MNQHLIKSAKWLIIPVLMLVFSGADVNLVVAQRGSAPAAPRGSSAGGEIGRKPRPPKEGIIKPKVPARGEHTAREKFFERALDEAREKGTDPHDPILVPRNDPFFKRLLEKLKVVLPEEKAAEILKELENDSKQLEKFISLLAKKKIEPFLRQLYDRQAVDPQTRKEVLSWLEEFIKDPKKVIEKTPEDRMFFSGKDKNIVVVIELDENWVQIIRIDPASGEIQLGLTEYIGPEKNKKPLQPKPELKPKEEKTPLSPESRMETAKDYFDGLVENLRKEGFDVKRSKNVAELDVVVTEGRQDEIPGENLIRPEEYDKRFGEDVANRLTVAREIYHNAWEEKNSRPKNPNQQIDKDSQDRLRLLQGSLEDEVYDRYGGSKSKIPNRRGGLNRWPESIPTEEDLELSRKYSSPQNYDQLADDRESLLKEYTPEAIERLAEQREKKINALAEIREQYKTIFSKLETTYDIRIDFKELHQAEPGNDIILVDKNGVSISLDDYITSGFPKEISP